MSTEDRGSFRQNVDQELLNSYQNKKNMVLNFIEKSAGLKINVDNELVVFDEYTVMEDGKIHVSAKLDEMKSSIGDFIVQFKWEISIFLSYALLTIFNLSYLLKLIRSISLLDNSIIPLNAYSLLGISIMGFATWLLSTNREFYGFYNRKFATLYYVIFSILLRVYGSIFNILYEFFIPFISQMEVTELMTENKIIGLGYIVTIVPATVAIVIMIYNVVRALTRDDNIANIKSFKLKHHMDFKGSNPYDYDIDIVKDMNTGERVVVKMHDRWLHGATIGATGTAKTSSVFLPMINRDLDTKIKNEDALKKELKKLVLEGKAKIIKPFLDKDFNMGYINKYVKPVEGYEDEFNKRISKYKSAGITVVAPDPSLPDNVYKLCKAKGVKINRIDPLHEEDGSLKPGDIGINPFYLSELIPEWAMAKEIVKKATLTADVMQIMFEMGGKSDPYFSSVNRIATTTTSMVVMLCHEKLYPGQKPKLSHVRDIINDFDKMIRYKPVLESINRQKNDMYKPILDIVNHEFLGLGRTKFEEHCKGLRIQFNNFLIHPDIERILCSDNTVDVDRMLKDGEVTTVNIELGDLGQVNSPCFGLFITISMIDAVLRRSGDEFSRNPHFWYVDELPVIVSPSMESCFSLFRKFRVAMMVAMQTLNQFDKSPLLKYLRGVILNSCGFHIVFGRTNPDDQDIYSALGGMMDKVTVTDKTTQNALSSENPMFNMGKEYLVERVARVEAGQIRERDFQEVTMFMVKDGRTLPPIEGKVGFLSKAAYKPVKRLKIDWEKLFREKNPYTKLVDGEEIFCIDEAACGTDKRSDREENKPESVTEVSNELKENEEKSGTQKKNEESKKSIDEEQQEVNEEKETAIDKVMGILEEGELALNYKSAIVIDRAMPKKKIIAANEGVLENTQTPAVNENCEVEKMGDFKSGKDTNENNDSKEHSEENFLNELDSAELSLNYTFDTSNIKK